MYNGRFFFDKFELYIEDDKGRYKPQTINNSNFETIISANEIEGWNQGIYEKRITKVREFSFINNQDCIWKRVIVVYDNFKIHNSIIKKRTKHIKSTPIECGLVIGPTVQKEFQSM